MTTTHLFVELLVIGFGALAWLFVLGAAIFGYDPFQLGGSPLPLAGLVPLLAIAYTLGILTDRLADWLLDGWDKKHGEKVFAETRTEASGEEILGATRAAASSEDKSEGWEDRYREGRRTMALHGRALWDHLEYVRSRLRICRGWALNGVLLLVSFHAFLGLGRYAPAFSVWQIAAVDAALVLLVVGAVRCWRSLNLNEYTKIQRQSVWLREQRERRGGTEHV